MKIPVIQRCASVAAAALLVLGTAATPSLADEADAKQILKAMSDYMASQEAISFDYDAVLEVVTKEDQKLALASSGSMEMNRPDKLHVTRHGGHANVEVFFDGKVLTLLGNNINKYVQAEFSGSIDELIENLRTEHGRAVPAGDLLASNPYDALMDGVTDIKDLGSGVIGGVECDYLAFRKEGVDWQIWIAQGDTPYPCRYSITTTEMTLQPQYIIQIRNWKIGSEVADNFVFDNSTGAEKVDAAELRAAAGDLPGHFKKGE